MFAKEHATTTAKITPAIYLTEMKGLVAKAVASGASLEQVTQATMGFAHALWDECYGSAEDELFQKIKDEHPTWGNIGHDMEEWGYNPN